MEKIILHSLLVLEIIGTCVLWMLKATWFATAIGIGIVIAGNLVRIVLAGFFLGRLPRSYVRAFD